MQIDLSLTYKLLGTTYLDMHLFRNNTVKILSNYYKYS